MKTHQETNFKVTQVWKTTKHKICFIPTMVLVAIKSKKHTTPYLGWQKMTFDNSKKEPLSPLIDDRKHQRTPTKQASVWER